MSTIKEKKHRTLLLRYRQGFKNIWRYYRGWKWLIFIGLWTMLIMSTYLVIIAKTTSVDTLQEALKTHTVILDENDNLAGTLRDQKGTYVSLDEISQEMKEVVVATEDKRFYEHSGFDVIGISRAMVRLVINRNTSGGGGSSITQQLVKNAFLTLDQTLNRKLKELFLAIEVEKQYTKDEILEMYLNHAYFGNGVWGIEDASLKYFGHSANTLDYAESIVLTGMLKGPSLYNPIDDYQATLERREVVTDLLVSQGIISQDQGEWIKASEIVLYDAYSETAQHEYPYYFDAVISEALEKTSISEEDLMSKGYTIYTSLNIDFQNALDNSYDQTWIFGDDELDPIIQSASIVVNPATGGVMAVYGGRGEYTYRGFNRAVDMYRSPGSTIKPLAVYVPALEKGYTIQSLVPDVVKGYGSNQYAPENYDRQTDPSGEVTLYYALAQSKNTTAVYLMDQLGIDVSVNKLQQFGIQIPQEDRSLTLALGAMQTGVTPLQLASAYASFSNDGIRYEGYFIRKIEDANGRVVYSNEKPTKYKVMTNRVADDMTSMMLETYAGYGTAYGAGPDIGMIAGKTGTTEISEDNMSTRDKWMVGYTPDFTIVTWVGLDNVTDGNLDELMPSGMGTLFNYQTTQLMYQSNQTPFSVQMASQTTQGSSNESFNSFFDQIDISINWDEMLNNASQWGSDAVNTASQWLENSENQIKEWLNSIQFP